jgi:hypothetical protein
LTLASIAVGIALAFTYHLTAGRTHLWLTKRVSRGLPVLFVAALFARFIVLGLVVFALGRWTTLDLIAVVLVFITVYTVLGGFSLYRLAVEGRPSASPVAP